MAIVLDATVGGASANTYGLVADADSYAEASPYAASWTALATADAKGAKLIQAARVLQSMGYAGEQYSSSQALPFPRSCITDPAGYAYPTTAIPACVKNAQIALAVWMSAQTGDQFGQDPAANLDSLSAGPVTLDFREATLTAGQDYLARVIIPMLVAGGVMAPMNSVRLTR